MSLNGETGGPMAPRFFPRCFFPAVRPRGVPATASGVAVARRQAPAAMQASAMAPVAPVQRSQMSWLGVDLIFR